MLLTMHKVSCHKALIPTTVILWLMLCAAEHEVVDSICTRSGYISERKLETNGRIRCVRALRLNQPGAYHCGVPGSPGIAST